MKRNAWIVFAGLFGATCAAVAWACADGGYETVWDAQSSAAILSPANDTRSNLILLMADRYGTKVADPAQMNEAIVPFDFPYGVMVDRLSAPVGESDPDARYQAYQKAEEERRAQYGVPQGSYDYSELCHSNRSGAEQFTAALNADPAVPAAEKPALRDARALLAKACDKAGETRLALGDVASPAGRAYARYVEGARLFYAEDTVSAQMEFEAIRPTSSPWLTEAAAYMRFRTALADAVSRSVDKWGEIADADKRDGAAIDRAEALRVRYLQVYPNGLYADSARDLRRRVIWLRGDRAALGAIYSAVISRKPDGRDPDLAVIQEIDNKLLPPGDGPGVTDPTLLAVIDLMRLRPKTEGYEVDYEGPRLTRAELNQQRPYFQSQPDLFTYLLAAEAFYQRKQWREVLELIPDAAHQKRFSYVQFSRQMLRGLALNALGDGNARAFWLSLLPGAVQPYQREAVELAIYEHDRKAGMIGRLLETGSPVLHPLIRQKAIEDDAGPGLLREQATKGATRQQREVALYQLLAAELHHGLYRDFLADQQLVGDRPQPKDGDDYRYWGWSVDTYEPDYQAELSPPPLYVFAAGGSDDLRACPDIRSTATSLAANPAGIRPRLCLAEFIRRKGFDDWNREFDEEQTRWVPRPRPGFSGKPVERMDIYLAVLGSPAASADDKAFALNRAIRCYQPSGTSSCGGEEVEVAVRKAWFRRLKNQYGKTAWARELKYYW